MVQIPKQNILGKIFKINSAAFSRNQRAANDRLNIVSQQNLLYNYKHTSQINCAACSVDTQATK